MSWGEVVFSRFLKNRRGNIAIITALTIIPLLGILGGGVDVIRATTMSSQLRASIDSAALAAANLNNSSDVETVVEEFIDSNLVRRPDFLSTLNVSVTNTVALNSKTVTITAEGHIDTYFLGLFGIETMPVFASSSATQSITNVEIALVLDISSSMRGTRITNLKDAAANFIDEMLDDDSTDVTSISIIPFGGTVNIGSDLFDDYTPTVAGTLLNPTKTNYNIGSNVVNETFRFTDGDNCIEYRSVDFSDDLIPVNSRGQVPHFWKWNNFNPWCPLDNSGMFMNSNNETDLIDHINGMTLSDGTGMDIGAMWGLKALSPKWKGYFDGDFADRPADYDDDTLKVLVVMTDGGITDQFRPQDYTEYNTHTNRSNNVADGAGSGNSGNNNNQQEIVDRGGASTPATTNKAVGYFKRVCDDAQADGAVVYTIGFQISAGSLPDSMLQYCASDGSKYYHVESLDIQSAFDSIAASVNALRITG